MTTQVPAAVQAVFEKTRGELDRRVKTLEETIAAMLDGELDESLRARGERDAHKLAGSLGMFGLPRGSELARELEQALAMPDGPALSDAPRLAERPDAILLDVMMPGIDGPTTFKRLQDDPRTRGIPVILLTAKVQAADRHHFEKLGVAGMLTKPFDPMALSGQVAAILATNSSGRVRPS